MTTDNLTNQITEQLEEHTQEANQFLEYLKGKLPAMLDFLFKILIVLLLFFIGKKVIKLIRKIMRKSFERAGLETGSIHFLDSLIKAVLYVILVASLATYLGIKEGSIAALLGSMGVGIVLALKESLSNIAGGFILLIMKPFVVGDYIKEDDSGNEGTVDRIDLFYTTLITPDNRTVALPNGILSNTSMTNISKQDKRQLRERVGISYEADIRRAKGILEKILREDPQVLQEEEREVFVDQLGDSAVMLGWRAWVRPENYWAARWRITEQIKYAFDGEGISIPYNQLEVTIKEGAKQGTESLNQEE